MADVARLEGCMGLSVSDARMFEASSDAFRVLEEALARAAGGEVMVEHVSVSIMPGETCATGPMSSTTWFGGRRLQGAGEDVKVEYVIHFPVHAGAEVAIQAAERSKRALEEISLNQMNQIVMEEMSRYHSLAMLSVHVTTPPTVHLIITYGPNMNHSNHSNGSTNETTGMYRPGMNHSNGSTTETTSMTMMTTGMYRPGMNHSNGSTTETTSMTMMTTGMYRPGMNHSNGSTTETTSMTMMTTGMYRPGMNHSNGSTTETTSMTMMTTGMYRPGMNHSNGSTTETTSMTWMTSTMMMADVARLEGCMGLSVSDARMFEASSDAFRVLEEALARAAGGEVIVEHVSVSIMPGETCATGPMSSTTWSGGRRLQGAEEDVKVEYVIHFPGHAGAEVAIQAAERSKRALEEISLNQMNQIVMEEMSRYHSLAMLSVHVTTPPTVHLIITYGPNMNHSNHSNGSTNETTGMYRPGMNHSNGSTTETTSMTMMTTGMYRPGMNHSNGSTTETTSMTMMTTGMYRPGMNHSNGSTTETTSMTWMTSTMMMADVARLEGCMGLSVSDASIFAGSSDAFRVLEEALARAAGGEVMVEHVSVSIVPGETCATGPMSSTTWSGGRRLQGAEEDVKVEYVIHFPGHAGAEVAIQAAERSKRALEEISLNQMNQIVMEEMSRYHSLAMLSVHVTTPPTVHLIITYGPNMNRSNHSNGSTNETTGMYRPGMNHSNGSTTETTSMTMMTTGMYRPGMNHSNGSTTETTSMTMMTTGMYRPGMNHSNGSTTETTSMTWMTSTMMMADVARLEGCMGLSVSDASIFAGSSDAFRVLEEALARAAGGEVMVEHVSVSIVPGETCATGPMSSTTWSGGRRLQGAEEDVKVEYVIHFPGHAGAEVAIQAAERSKRALEEISLNQMNQIVMEEMSRYHSLAMLSVHVTTPPTVHLIITYGPSMNHSNHSNGSTNETTGMYRPGMNHSNGSTTETTSMTMMTTGMYRPGINHSNVSTTETTSMTWMTSTMMMADVARLEGCMGLSVSDARMFAGSSDAFRVLEEALARAAGSEVMVEHVSVSIMPGETCATGPMSSTTWFGGRRLQGAGEDVKVEYVIHFPGHAGAEVAIQAAERSKRALEEISLNQMNQIVMEEMSRYHSLAMLSVHVTTPPTVHLIITYGPNMNHSNGSTTETTSMTMMTTGMYRPGMNHSNGSTTETTSMTWMTSTMMMADVARLEGCMGLSVSDAGMFAGSSDAFRVLEEALARAAGGEVMVEHVSVSIMPGETCATGPMSSTTWSGGRRLQGAEEDVKVEYVIHFPGHAGAEVAIQAAERSKRALEEISLNQMNQIVMEEMSRYHSLAMLSVHVTTPPTVHLIITYGPNMNHSNHSNGSTNETTGMYRPGMNHSNGSTTETTSMTMMTTGMYRPGMNHSNGSTTETTSMTWMTSTMMMADVARLEGCMGLSVSDASIFAGSSDAFQVLEEALARAAGSGVMVEHVSVSIVPGETCATGPMSSTTWFGGRRLQGAGEDVKVEYVIHFPGHAGAEVAIQAAERSKRALEEISLNQMNQIVMEEMSRYHSLAMLSVHVTTPPTVHLIITYGPNMNHSNGSTTETTGMYRPGMNHSNGSTTETTSMTMMTTGMYRPGMNHSNGSTTETTSMTWMTSTMMMADVARLEGCMGLSVSDARMFAGSADAFRVLEEALARAAGGEVMVEHVSVSIMPGETCATGPMSSTTWSGGRRLQGAEEDVKVEYVIHFTGHAGADAAIQAAERSKRALEEISLNQMNQIVMEEMSRYHSLAMLSVHVTTPPTVHLIITYGPNMNHSNGSTTETTSMTMMTTGMYRPGMNHSNGSTTETTSMTWMTSTMMADVARLEGCMGLSVSDAGIFAGSSDAFRVLEETLARAAGGEVMAEHVSVSIMPGETCPTGPMLSTTWSGGRRLQGAEEDVKVEYMIHFSGHAGADAAIQAAERSKRALEEISLNQMNQIVIEEMSRYHSLAMLSVHVTTPPTVHLIITYGPNMNHSNHSNGSTNETTGMYRPGMNHSNGSTTETTSMTMMTTGMYRPGMNHSNGSTTETTSMTWMTSTMMMADVARLEGCMGLSVSDASIFAGSSDAFQVLEEALARAAGSGVMVEHVSVSIVPGETCATGPMSSTTWFGGRRLQGAEEDAKVEYVIHFPGHAGAEVAIQAAERSKRALEEISLNQMNQIVMEEMSRYHSLAMLSVHVTTPPTVHLIITYGPNMNHSNHSNGSTTETTSMTWMTSTMMMADVARLEGCMGLSVSDARMFAGSSDAFRLLEEALARAAGGEVMVEHVSVSIMPGETCATGPMSSTTWSGGRRLQGAEEDVKVEYVIHFPGHAGAEAAIQAAERSKRALEEISLNQMNQIVMEEMSRYHSLAMLLVHVTTPPTVHLIITYGPNMNHSNGSTTETTSMTWMTSTMMMADVARLEGCMGLSVSDAGMFAGSSDAFRVLEEALARAAGGEVMVEHVSVSIMPGETCATGPMSSTTWLGGRRLQGAEEDVKVKYVIRFPSHAGAEAAIQAAERSKRALEEISLNQMNQIVMEEMSRYHSLAMLSVHVTTPPTVHLIITYGPNMNHSNGSTTETTSMTWMTSTMMMADVARLEGCMGLSVSDARMFAGSSDAFRVLEEALARAAGSGVMVEHVSVSIMPGETCATGPMSSTSWSGGRRLQGAGEDVKVEYVIHFPGHAGAEVAIQAAERSKRALEEISLNQMNQIVMEEMSRYHSLAMLSVHVTTPPTVHLIITYGPNMNHSNGSTTETTSMTWMTSTMMMADVARLEGCMGLSVSDAGMFAGSSDAFRVLEEALARAAGGEVMVEHVSVSIMPGETCGTGPMSSTTWSGGRRLQGAEEDVKVEYVIHFPGHAGAEVAIQAAERSKRALEEISLNQMNQIVMEEMSRYHSLAMLSVHVTTPPTVHLIITYGPNMNHSNGSTTETTSMTWMTSTMMMADVARLEGCMGLSVSDARMFAGSSDAFRVLEEALARAAGSGVMVEHVSVSIMPGETCATGPMSSTTWSGGRHLQGAEEDVKVEYLIHFPGHAGAEAAIQAAERSKRALEEISLNQMNQIVMEEMSRYHSLAMLSVHVTTPPTVHLIITYGPNMNHSNGSTTETTSMTWMTSTMMMADVARLEGCMGLSVSDAGMFAGSSDAFRVLEEALARAAGGEVMVEHVSVSIMPGETCATGPMSSTTWSGGRRLQGAEEDVKVEYPIHFPGHAGAEAAIQAAERSKRALEEISLNQMNQIVMEEMSRYHSLAML